MEKDPHLIFYDGKVRSEENFYFFSIISLMPKMLLAFCAVHPCFFR